MISEALGWRIVVLGILLSPGLRFLALEWQLAFVLPVLTFFGLPHGAADWWVAESLWRGRRWLLPFALGYLLLTGLAVFVIWWFPILSLLIFLAISIWHFGTEDAEACALQPNIASCLSFGLPPVVAAGVFWPEATTWILGALRAVPPGFTAVQQIACGAGIVWLAAFVTLCIRQAPNPFTLVQPVLIWLLFGVCPPLVSFTIYMVAVHSPRHLRGLDGWLAERGHRRGSDRILVAISLISASLVAVTALTVWRNPEFVPGTSTATAAVFWGLAALTIPHTVLSLVAERMLPSKALALCRT